MKEYLLLIFDWDGTLVDSAGFAIEALQQTALQFGYPVPKAKDIYKHYGMHLDAILKTHFPHGNLNDLLETFYQYFTEDKLAVNFFPGVIDTLNYLKQQGFILAVATNRERTKLQHSLKSANLDNFFHAIRCPEDNDPKPAPDMLLSLLEELNVHAQDTLMIGDTIWDMQCANNAKVDALAVCHHTDFQEQLATYNPIGFIDDIHKLKHIFKLKQIPKL